MVWRITQVGKRSNRQQKVARAVSCKPSNMIDKSLLLTSTYICLLLFFNCEMRLLGAVHFGLSLTSA